MLNKIIGLRLKFLWTLSMYLCLASSHNAQAHNHFLPEGTFEGKSKLYKTIDCEKLAHEFNHDRQLQKKLLTKLSKHTQQKNITISGDTVTLKQATHIKLHDCRVKIDYAITKHSLNNNHLTDTISLTTQIDPKAVLKKSASCQKATYNTYLFNFDKKSIVKNNATFSKRSLKQLSLEDIQLCYRYSPIEKPKDHPCRQKEIEPDYPRGIIVDHCIEEFDVE